MTLGVEMQSGLAWVKASDLLSVRGWELRSATGKSWLWHSLVAVGEEVSVRSQGGFVTDKPP